MTVRGYELFLQNFEMNYSFKIARAYNCDEVLDQMKKNKLNFYDMVLLDINLPTSTQISVIGGEDLGKKIRQRFPKTKIVVHTSMNDPIRISNIMKSINPEGFIIKSDLLPEVLEDAIRIILNGSTYYSLQTNRILKRNKYNDIFLDSSDLKILYYLSKGELMKNLPLYVPLSIATIERRKKRLKLLFNIPTGSDKELLDVTRAKGFL